MEAVQTVASCEHEQIHIDFAKRVLFASCHVLLVIHCFGSNWIYGSNENWRVFLWRTRGKLNLNFWYDVNDFHCLSFPCLDDIRPSWKTWCVSILDEDSPPTLSDKEMIDAEGADENGDNLISEEEFDAWLVSLRDLEIQEMQAVDVATLEFKLISSLLTFCCRVFNREKCLMIVPDVKLEIQRRWFPFSWCSLLGNAMPVKSGGCIWCYDMNIVYYCTLSYISNIISSDWIMWWC